MNSSELKEAFRSDVRDTARPYFWTDDELWRYMNEAYRMFVRLTGGVADFDSDICAVDIVAGEAVAEINPNILRVMNATRRTDSHPIEILNHTDLGKMRSSDYGQAKALVLDNRAGNVNYAVIGLRKNTLRWVMVPEVDDVADLHVYRLPLGRITGPDQAFTDVEEDHHTHLMKWMKHLAFLKQDADTFDQRASEQAAKEFTEYCDLVKREWERYKHKSRSVTYGGL